MISTASLFEKQNKAAPDGLKELRGKIMKRSQNKQD